MTSKKDKKITIIESPRYRGGKLNGELVYDEFSRFLLPSRAAHTLEAVLRADQWTNVKVINPMFGKNGKFTSQNLRDIYSSDYVLGSIITGTALPTYELMRTSKHINPNQIGILGGHHVLNRAHEALRESNGDIAVKREGEHALVEAMNATLEDRYGLDDVRGIVFRNQNGEFIETKPRPFLSPKKLSEFPHPIYDRPTWERSRAKVLETTRGCPENCDFCLVTQFYGGKYRQKHVDYVIEARKRIQGMGKRDITFITDDNVVGDLKNKNPKVVEESINRFTELAEAFHEHGFHRSFNIVQITSYAGKFPEVIKALKKMGVNMVCVGLESMNPITLERLGKPFTVQDNQEGIRAFRDAGIWMQGMTVIGPDDDHDYFKYLKEWASKNLDSVQYFSAIHLPGTRFERQMKTENRAITNAYYLMDGHHTLLYPSTMTPLEQQLGIHDLYYDFYSVKNSLGRIIKSSNRTNFKAALGLLGYTMFGGVSKVAESNQMHDYINFLTAVSKTYPNYEAFANR